MVTLNGEIEIQAAPIVKKFCDDFPAFVETYDEITKLLHKLAQVGEIS
jgi:hypothetical protein